MLFTSLDFFLFLPLVVAVFALTPVAQRWAVLLLASYVFYGFAQPFNLIYLGAVTLVGWICITVTFAIAVILFFPFLAVAVRRLHDIGRGKWWVLFFFIIPIVGWILALIDGQPITNKYGPDPKGRG